MRLIDSHAHLESPRFDADRDAVIARAAAAGVEAIVTCGADLASSEAAIALAEAHPALWAAVGIHPHEARHAWVEGDGGGGRVDEAAMGRLRQLARHPRVVAIGEIGLDYHYDFSPRDAQCAVLAAQLCVADELSLPVVLHNRESDPDFVSLLESGPVGIRGVLHCFLSTAELARWALDRGLYLGVAGPVTFRGMDGLGAILRDAPLERLLIETDSPYLAPHPHRGKRNEPAYVPHVAEKLAEIRGMPVEELARITADNGRRLFGVT